MYAVCQIIYDTCKQVGLTIYIRQKKVPSKTKAITIRPWINRKILYKTSRETDFFFVIGNELIYFCEDFASLNWKISPGFTNYCIINHRIQKSK